METVTFVIQCGHVNIRYVGVMYMLALLLLCLLKWNTWCLFCIHNLTSRSWWFFERFTHNLFFVSFAFIKLYTSDIRALLLSNNCALGVIVCLLAYWKRMTDRWLFLKSQLLHFSSTWAFFPHPWYLRARHFRLKGIVHLKLKIRSKPCHFKPVWLSLYGQNKKLTFFKISSIVFLS